RRQRRVPVEDDAVAFADDHRRARDGARAVQLVFDAELLQAVGQEADSLLVLEVGLLHPALRLAAQNAVDVAVRAALDTDREFLLGALRTDDDALWRRCARLRRTVLCDDLTQCESELAQTVMTDGRDLEHPVAARLKVGPHELGEIAGL